MATSFRDAALLLLGHGSTLNADSSAPTYQHAEEIQRRGVFAEVHVGFWKEEPNFRQALRQTSLRQVYVVPNFISSGYFTEQIIPRELGLTGSITHIAGKDVFYCAPVGLHASMTEALLRRASQVVADSKEPILNPAKTACLFICGHGTSMNDNSTKIIHEQAAIIRSLGIYADCQAVLMEQTPFVKEWRTLTTCPDVIVVPFFISDGLHSFEDIPVLLGLTPNVKEQSFINPHKEDQRRLWYATAIGTEASIADVILAQVKQFQEDYAPLPLPSLALPPTIQGMLKEFFRTHPAPWNIGELSILSHENETFSLMHTSNLSSPLTELRQFHSLEDLRELIRLDFIGNFRPLRAAPNLRNGWIYHAAALPELHGALDYIYPAELANWVLQQHGLLPVTPWRETAERQTGRFRVVRDIDEIALGELVRDNCHADCLKQRLWSSATEETFSKPGEIPLLCPEACNYLVGKAREKLKGSSED